MSSIDAASLTRQLNSHALATHSNGVTRQHRGLIQDWIARYLLWRRVRRDEAWLKRQPDYLLRDIGLDRGEIGAALRAGRYL